MSTASASASAEEEERDGEDWVGDEEDWVREAVGMGWTVERVTWTVRMPRVREDGGGVRQARKRVRWVDGDVSAVS